MRQRYCKVCGDWHEMSAWPAACMRRSQGQRSDLPMPMLIRDQLDDLQHPSDGNFYDSKSEFRKITALNGGIEMGNDEAKDMRYTDTVTASEVADAYHKVEQGYQPHVADLDPLIDG